MSFEFVFFSLAPLVVKVTGGVVALHWAVEVVFQIWERTKDV